MPVSTTGLLLTVVNKIKIQGLGCVGLARQCTYTFPKKYRKRTGNGAFPVRYVPLDFFDTSDGLKAPIPTKLVINAKVLTLCN
ncbi:hypothetical protein AEBE7430_09110 [Aeromonas bestiarum]